MHEFIQGLQLCIQKEDLGMKSNGHYETIAAIKQTTEIIESLIGKKVKSSKVKQWNIRDMKREYRWSRPRKTRRV